MPMNELKACPFCGSNSIDWIYDEETGEGYHLCNGCSAHGPACYHCPCGMADGYWNKRRVDGFFRWIEGELKKIEPTVQVAPMVRYSVLNECRTQLTKLLGGMGLQKRIGK